MADKKKQVKETTVGGLDALEQAKQKLKEAREAVKAIAASTSLRGAKVAINKAYNELYKQEMTQEEKIKEFFEKVDEVKAQFLGEDA